MSGAQGRRLRLAGIALLLAAVGGCGGSGGQSDRGALSIRSDKPPALLTDRQWPVSAFRLQGVGSIGCAEDRYRAVLKHPSTSLRLHLLFRGCHLHRQAIVLDTRECALVLAPQARSVSPVPIECQGGGAIGIAFAGGCDLRIPPQTARGGAHFFNTGKASNRTFDVTSALRGVAYNGSLHSRCGVPAGTDVSLAFHIELFGSEFGSGAHGKSVGVWVGAPL